MSDQHSADVANLRKLLTRDYAEPMTKEEIIRRRLEGLDQFIVNEIREILWHYPLLKVGVVNFDRNIA